MSGKRGPGGGIKKQEKKGPPATEAEEMSSDPGDCAIEGAGQVGPHVNRYTRLLCGMQRKADTTS